MLRRLVALAMALVFVAPACQIDPAADIVYGDGAEPSPEVSASVCAPGDPTVINGMEIESRCPRSKPVPLGTSRKLVLGTVVAKVPCRVWPDFAGSWWEVVKPYPKHLAHIGHQYVPGKMTLKSEDLAVFIAEAIEMHMGRRDDPTVRFPAKGDLKLMFERVEGPVPAGGCA